MAAARRISDAFIYSWRTAIARDDAKWDTNTLSMDP